MDKIRRQIDVLLFDGINVLDVAGPAQAFSAAYIDGDKAYGCAMSRSMAERCVQAAAYLWLQMRPSQQRQARPTAAQCHMIY
ncbi:hypothetical protein N9413_07605 [Paracoccaceae bacterium]|jgi:hypothetical protein|nr:hypothetical protein [Paracoccaceae bacterium]